MVVVTPFFLHQWLSQLPLLKSPVSGLRYPIAFEWKVLGFLGSIGSKYPRLELQQGQTLIGPLVNASVVELSQGLPLTGIGSPF